MSSPGRPSKLQLSFTNLRVDWVEISGLGRLAVAGVALALGVTLVLGASITQSARGHLLDARSAMVAANIAALPPFPSGANASIAEYAVFDVAVRVNVLGGETVRVKVWDETGTIVYSDAEELQGRTFDLPSYAAEAFAEGNKTHISDLSEPAHSFDRGHGELIEFYVALPDPSGTSAYVVEVEQDARGFNNALSLITRNVWASIGVGLAAIGLVMAVGVAARTRDVNSRRRQAEGLLDSSFKAQEEERRRVVSALHDDIGQPMYRLLYGLEGSQARLEPSDPVSVELGKLAGIVRDMDSTLRNELRLLHFELAADTGLSTALEELADLTRAESELDVELTVDDVEEAPAVARTEMYRAAREALTNVRRHSSADKVSMHLFREGGRLVLDVSDNGTRQDSKTKPGLGLSTTRQRFKALDGDVSLEFSTSGATFSAWLPTDESSR
jgi:signal transduction histidine kinase